MPRSMTAAYLAWSILRPLVASCCVALMTFLAALGAALVAGRQDALHTAIMYAGLGGLLCGLSVIAYDGETIRRAITPAQVHTPQPIKVVTMSEDRHEGSYTELPDANKATALLGINGTLTYRSVSQYYTEKQWSVELPRLKRLGWVEQHPRGGVVLSGYGRHSIRKLHPSPADA